MSKFLVAGLALIAGVASGVGPASAQAQENITDTPPNVTKFTASVKVTPNRAGTPKKPQGAVVRVRADAFTEPGYERPIFQSGYALFPRAGNYNGDDFPRCYKRTLDRYGTDRCPKHSRIGSGTAVGYADNVVTKGRIELFNAGNKLAFAYITVYNPALVREPVPVRIQEIPSGQWKYKASFALPEVLQIIAGIPIAARSIDLEIGRGNLIESTSCPKSRRWPYEIRGRFSNGSDYTHRGSTPCKPPLPGR